MGRTASVCVLFSLLGCAVMVSAQPTEHVSALTYAAADASIVTAGHMGRPRSECPGAHRAFLAKLTREGGSLWRRGPSQLLSRLESLEPAHVLASTVDEVAADPVSGELFAMSEVFVGWRQPGGDGVATARGTLLLKLDAEGAWITDTYFGDAPAGAPLTPAERRATCPPEDWPSHATRSVVVEADGSIVVSEQLPEGGRFQVSRWTDDLIPHGSAETPAAEKVGFCSFSFELMSVTPLSNTQVESGTLPDLDDEDGHVMRIGEMPGHVATNAGPGHGLEAEFKRCSAKIPDKLSFNLNLNNMGDPIQVDVYLENVHGDLVWIEGHLSDDSGVLKTVVVVDDPTPYLLADRVIMQVKLTDVTGNCNDTTIDHCDGWEE